MHVSEGPPYMRRKGKGKVRPEMMQFLVREFNTEEIKYVQK